jgi:GGDEF domain-containing protein
MLWGKRPVSRRAAANLSLLAEAAGLPTFRDLRPLLDRELRRARRYERPLALLVLSDDPVFATGQKARSKLVPIHAPNGNHNGDGANDAGLRIGPLNNGDEADADAVPMRCILLATLLRSTVREIDLAGCLSNFQEFALLLPESDRNAAELTARRINRALVSRRTQELRAGVAVYPEDGLMLDDLITSARRAILRDPMQLVRTVEQERSGA